MVFEKNQFFIQNNKMVIGIGAVASLAYILELVQYNTMIYSINVKWVIAALFCLTALLVFEFYFSAKPRQQQQQRNKQQFSHLDQYPPNARSQQQHPEYQQKIMNPPPPPPQQYYPQQRYPQQQPIQQQPQPMLHQELHNKPKYPLPIIDPSVKVSMNPMLPPERQQEIKMKDDLLVEDSLPIEMMHELDSRGPKEEDVFQKFKFEKE